METQTIQLTPRENQLRNLLTDAARYIDESKEIKDKIELRWAGGWVRDKLLGLQSHDIDVAINAMTGVGFCEKMHEYLKDEANMKKHSLTKKDVGSLHKIAANPDKSKHLETVNTRLYDFDLDFVNLRKETYSDDSRNPQMEFGTAEEDALRRDATINALFYNLHTDLVEDFTGGLEDLASKLIKTPLEPYTTFKDDPLRVLRLIRFASRLGFKIDIASKASMSDPTVMDALKLKISRERVGVELGKMLKGPNPRSALQLIDHLGLYSIIFTDPTGHPPPSPDSSDWHLVYECFEVLQNDKTVPGSIYQSLVRSEEAKYHAWILAALTPLRALSPSLPQWKPPPVATNVAREGIKAENKVCNLVTAALCNAESIFALKLLIAKQKLGYDCDSKAEALISKWDLSDTSLAERSTLGLRIRKWHSQGGDWRLQVLFTLFAEVIKDHKIDSLPHWQALVDHLESMNLMDAETMKPLVDGKRLQRDLNAKPGPWMKYALELCMAIQLKYPDDSASYPEKVIRMAIESLAVERGLLACAFSVGQNSQPSKPATNKPFVTNESITSNNMFEVAQAAARDAIKNVKPESTELALIQPSSLPPTYSLSHVIAKIVDSHTIESLEEAKLQHILILRSCLENSTRVPETQDQASILRLSVWLSEVILPESSIINYDDDSSGMIFALQMASVQANSLTAPLRDRVILFARQKGVTGLCALQTLLDIQTLPQNIDPRILLALTAFTSSRDPWTTTVSESTATAILSKLLSHVRSKSFIVDHVLHTFIRPLFSKSKLEAVTASGRKAMPSSAPPPRFDVKSADERAKPWMFDVPYAITVFEWAVANSSEEIATAHFNLYIPPLLTLLDSTLTSIRARALSILSTFIPLLTPTILTQTGLGEVFEDAVIPTLLFLPSVTPVNESVQLLEPAYHALHILGSTLYRDDRKTKEGSRGDEQLTQRKAKEIRFWDRVVRKGVLMGYAHANEHPAIVEVLLRNLGLLVEKMGLHAVKHLKVSRPEDYIYVPRRPIRTFSPLRPASCG
ncbi:tRNA nucleotidyltransferase [Hyphodiscus hymeniophilus]|uniref:tRNA nucleotidyltransferase n=1 Tax=Hyphodiscus hymeniophilus TaxID=353542 RepID=A0A9P6VPY8_9HELO|nr:tRNA nucleotidyltransferase [Hyphodiscus hymeniophilus]